MGRNVGKNSLRDNADIDRVQLGTSQLPETTNYKNSTEKMHAQLVADLNKKFFARDATQVTNEIKSQLAEDSRGNSQVMKKPDTMTESFDSIKEIAKQPLKTQDLAKIEIDKIESDDQQDDLTDVEQASE